MEDPSKEALHDGVSETALQRQQVAAQFGRRLIPLIRKLRDELVDYPVKLPRPGR